MGPAIVAFPHIYACSGWLCPTVVLFLVFGLSSLSATMLCEAMQRIPGNERFQATPRYEFSTTLAHYWGPRWETFGQVLVNICLQALNIASIIVASQVADEMVEHFMGTLPGVELFPTPGFVSRSRGEYTHRSGIVNLGFVLCAVVSLPFGFLSLEENMGFQWFSFVALILAATAILAQFLTLPFHWEALPAMRPGFENQAQVLGVILFSFAFIVCVPSWVNEKKHGVRTSRVMWGAAATGLLLKFSVGFFGALTYPGNDKPDATNVLTLMNDVPLGSKTMQALTRMMVYLFNLGTLVPGIPVFSVLVRYNLVSGGICGKRWGFWWGTVMPWLVSAFLYTGRGFSFVVNWTALLFQGFVNFVLPALLYVSALKRYPRSCDLRPAGKRLVVEASMTITGGGAYGSIDGGFSSSSFQADGVAVDQVRSVPPLGLPQYLWCSPRATGILTAALLLGMVSVVILFDFYFLVFLGEDVVD